MFLKIFLAAITVCSLLGCLGANRRDNKRIAAVVAIVALILFTVATLAESSIKAKEAQAAAVKKEATITGKGDAWGTITIKDDTGETREYYWKCHSLRLLQFHFQNYYLQAAEVFRRLLFCLAAFSHAPSRLVLPCRRFFSLKKLLKNLLTFHTLYSWRNRCYFFTVCSISY